ncbi:MAG: hypothetical protein GXO76_12490 [Calditrichaeota bacterium]|nr:hypothetical protein [Calditrichota bacterium]
MAHKQFFVSLQEMVLIALLGALWAAVEIHVGFLLHLVKLPFAGILLTFFGVIILLVGRTFVPRTGTAVLTGLIAALSTFLFLGAIVIYPMIGIVMESIFVEIGLAFPFSSRINYQVSGVLGLLWSFFHPFIVQGLVAGLGFWKIFSIVVEKGAKLFHLAPQQAFIVLLLLFSLFAAAGLLAGMVGWSLSNRLRHMVSYHWLSQKSIKGTV